MFYKHIIIDDGNEKKLYLYIDFDYEFSRDFSHNGKREKEKTLYEQASQYIKDKDIDFKKGKVLLVVGGLIIGSLMIMGSTGNSLQNEIGPSFKYVEHVDIFGDNKDIVIQPEQKDEIAKNDSIVKEQIPVINKEKNITKTPIKESVPANVPTKENVSAPIVETKEPVQQTPITQAEPQTIVTVRRQNGSIEQIELEEYLVGVVAGEMPASFNAEALKAQSIIARTYTLKKISQKQVIKDDVSNQVYKDINQQKALWGSDFNIYQSKIKNAVSATKGQYLTYNGTYIEAVYHSTSNGQTEDAAVVWGNSFPYLKSVDSHWDLDASSYIRETTKEFNILSSIIGLDFNEATKIDVLSKTPGNRINEIKINDSVFTGIELRTLLGLRSTDFDITINDGIVTFTTRGYGHGVGMSQYGANGMAKEGYTYRQILNHYYPGTKITEA